MREIEEECNVTVKIGEKIGTTWHTYTMNKKCDAKKTRWYVMDVIDDSKMAPSIEEDIEEVRWMNPKEVYHSLQNSYKSINYVFEKYHELKGVKCFAKKTSLLNPAMPFFTYLQHTTYYGCCNIIIPACERS